MGFGVYGSFCVTMYHMMTSIFRASATRACRLLLRVAICA